MLVYDLVDPVELIAFVRNIPLPQFTLAAHLPNDSVDDIEYRLTSGTLFQDDAATFRAYDAESPIGKRGGARRISGELPPISRKMQLGEEARLRLRGLLGGRGQAPALAAQVFNDAATLTRSVAARVELARGRALYDGKVVIEENGISATADFGFISDQRVAATDDSGDYWSDPAADIIGMLTTWVAAYVERTNGQRPGELQTSTTVRGYMLRNTAIANAVGVPSGSPGLVTVAGLNQVLDAYDLPPVTIYDTAVPVGGVSTRVIPANRALLLPPRGSSQLGATFYGITAEALELADARQITADQAPGLVAVVEKTFDPVSTWTKVAGITIPALANPELITTAQVLA